MPIPDFGSEKYRKVALQGALESIVLLKNEDYILPLSKNRKILVTGPTADSLNALNGSWSGTWQGTDPKYNTPNKLTPLRIPWGALWKDQRKVCGRGDGR